MSASRGTIAAAAVLASHFLGAVAPVSALTVIDQNATIDYRVEDGLSIVDGLLPRTMVQIIDPAEIEEDLMIFGSSIVDVLGGRIDEYLHAHNTSIVNIRGGIVEDDVIVDGSSRAEMTGGILLDYVIAAGSSVVSIGGGSLWGIEARGDADVFLTGGSIRAWPQERGLIASESGTIFVLGTDFNYPYGRLAGDQFGTLTGLLHSGDAIIADFSIADGGSIILVPEPTGLQLGLPAVLAATGAWRMRILNRKVRYSHHPLIQVACAYSSSMTRLTSRRPA
jgi:hypothetical protein